MDLTCRSSSPRCRRQALSPLTMVGILGLLLLVGSFPPRAVAQQEHELAPAEELADDGVPAPQTEDDGAENGLEGASEGIRLIDTPSLTVTAKNVQQKDEDGDSQFGFGLDWAYNFYREFDQAIDWAATLKGSGFVSLNDPNSSRSDASQATNFNSIINEGRIGIPEQVFEDESRRVEPPPQRALGESDEQFRARMEVWIKRTRDPLRSEILRQAANYWAFDVAVHARSESDQDFGDTQFALGGEATLASGWAANWILRPLQFLVPPDPHSEGIGRLVQSPQLFLAFEEVLNADHRETIDGDDDDEFERFRFEVAWRTELLINGLFPFVNFNLFQELGASDAIEDADKDTATFIDVGLSYYVPNLGGLGERFLRDNRGPFVTVRYADGRLPPYLESYDQISLGFGIDF